MHKYTSTARSYMCSNEKCLTLEFFFPHEGVKFTSLETLNLRWRRRIEKRGQNVYLFDFF